MASILVGSDVAPPPPLPLMLPMDPPPGAGEPHQQQQHQPDEAAIAVTAPMAPMPPMPPPGFAPMESGGTYPRVAHRHLYLWIERKANERGPEAARRLKTIPSLEAFYGEVAAANAGNKHYSPLKLQEMVVRAPPYSLLYNRTLNMSTNVLKRWNRTNGMTNWFLFRAGSGPPSAAEVIQLSRVHVARALMRRADYTRVFGPAAAALVASIKAEAAAAAAANGDGASSVASSSSSLTGGGGGGGKGTERRQPGAGGKKAAAKAANDEHESTAAEDAVGGGGGGPVLLLPAAAPVGVATPEALLAWLSRRHPSSPISLSAVRAAVEAGGWELASPTATGGSSSGGGDDTASYAPNVTALDGWSAEAGLWQEFARLCLERGVKFDQCLFDFPDLPTASSSSSSSSFAAAASAAAAATMKLESPRSAAGENGVAAAVNGSGGVASSHEEGQQEEAAAADATKPLIVPAAGAAAGTVPQPPPPPPPPAALSAAAPVAGTGKARKGRAKRGRGSSTGGATASGAGAASSPSSAAAAADARAAKRRRSIAHLFAPGEQLLEEEEEEEKGHGIVLGRGGAETQLPAVVAGFSRRLVARVEGAGAGGAGGLRLLGGRLHSWGDDGDEAADGSGFWHGKALWAPRGDPCVRLLFPAFLPTIPAAAAPADDDEAAAGDAWASSVDGTGTSSAVDSLAAGTPRFVLGAAAQGQGRAQQVAVLVFGAAGGGGGEQQAPPQLVVTAFLISADPPAAGQARFLAKFFLADPDGLHALPGLARAPVVLDEAEGDGRAHPDDRASARLWRMHAAAAAKAAAVAAAGAGTVNGNSKAASSRGAKAAAAPPPPGCLSALLQLAGVGAGSS